MTFHDGGCQCNWAIVIKAGHCGILWYRDDGSGLETGTDNSGGQRDTYIGMGVSQLICTFLVYRQAQQLSVG